jgi:hypothetical protein
VFLLPYTEDGDLDTEFATAGVLLDTEGDGVEVNDLVAQLDGSVLIVASQIERGHDSNLRGICLLLALVLGGVATVLLRFEQACTGSLLLFLTLGACGAAVSHLFPCFFCKDPQMVVCFMPSQKCTKCGLIHIIKWE